MKQVPDTTEIKINPETNTLIRAGVPSIVNPFDAYALELAVRLKEKHGGTVTVLSMGPDQAIAALRECLSVGADKAVLVTDRAFGGSDTLATSYILSTCVKKLGGFDLIFTGKQAIGGDTGQVGPEMAEHLNIPQVTCLMDVEVNDGKLEAKREHDKGYEMVECSLPALVSVIKTDYEPRYPSIRSKMAANKAEITRLTAADLDLDVTRVGLKGSSTKVKRTFTPPRKTGGTRIEEETPVENAKKLLSLLKERAILLGR